MLDVSLTEYARDSASEVYASAPDILIPHAIENIKNYQMINQVCWLTQKSLKTVINEGEIVSDSVHNSSQTLQTTVN